MSAMRKKTGDPDAFLLTARSALPLGDALKSYYEEIGGEPPVITSIAANQDTSYAYFRDENNLTPAVEQGFIQETSRLKGILPSDANVCVVDQFVSSGYTIAYASELLVNAGAANISGIRGSWYVQAYRRPSTEDTVHTTKMLRAVGRKAAQAGKDF
jgi:hypoxanthine phosphoribosyltransferase